MKVPHRIRLAAAGLGFASVASAQVSMDRTTPAAPATQQGASAKKAITPDVIKNWNTIRQSVLSNDGKFFAYVIGASESDATVVLKGTAADGKETRFAAGNGGGQISISGDSRWMGFMVAPPRPPQSGSGGRAGGAGGGRGGGGGGAGAAGGGGENAAQARNKFALVNLATGEKREFDRIRRFVFAGEKPQWIAMQGYPASTPAPAANAADAGRGGGRAGGGAPAGGGGGGPSDLLLYNIASGDLVNVGQANEFAFDDDGELLAYTMDNSDQVGNAVQVMNLASRSIRALESERALYRSLSWTDSLRALTVMRGKIDSLTRDTLFSIVAFTQFANGMPAKKQVFNPAEHADFPAGMKIAAERAPRFSDDLSIVFFGVREAKKAPQRGQPVVADGGRGNNVIQAGAPGAGGTINQPSTQATEDPSLVLWHWKDPRPQPQQIVQESADRAFNYLTEYRFAENKVVRLVTDSLRSVTILPGDKFAYGTDNSPYQQAAVTTGRNYSDIYSIDLKTGAKKTLFTKNPGNGGFRPSPDGKTMLYWGTDGHYWVLDMATGERRNITKTVPTSFVDTEDDHNNIVPPAIAAVGWSKDNAAVLLSDNWDVWKVPVNGGVAVNLTGNGRKDQIRYQRVYNFETPAAGGGRGGRGGGAGGGIDLSKPIYFGTYGEWTKKEGLAKVDASKPGAQPVFFEPARYSIQKARDAETFVYTRQTFTEFPNYWTSGPDFKGPRQLTDANPQMKDLAWSSGTRLINYTSDKGDKLQGAMYLPANFDPAKKYPMLVTIYEKRSQNMNSFVSPSETRAPDPALYTSRGYIVFDPDIVYRVNDPGMSAVWCVVPAVKAAIATGFVDPANVGLWGHSWGGYQTAFLVTQTNIFNAAIAGAPLTNMVSMYGSMYWNTGGTDAAIFESSQGRFKGSPAENWDAYIRNSPVYFANKVKTPLIILHNDKDGAVDFNQGVTYYNTLLNLGKDVMMLEYVGENHGLSRPVNQRDYAARMREFFDYHLKDAPIPDWVKDGVPRLKMDEHLKARKDSAGIGMRVIIP